MPDFSVITCISKPDIYDKCLLSSINSCRGDFDVEIIPIINNNNRYSASNALNIGIDVSRSEYLVFAHQDVKLLDNWFHKALHVISNIDDDWAVLGSAGISLDFSRSDIGMWGGSNVVDTVAVGTVFDSDDAIKPYWDGIKTLSKSHCVDECLFILKKSSGLRFDTQFTGFHFYGVDICLQARAAAYSVYCADLPIVHYGQYSASFVGNSRYWVYLRLLFNKWRLLFPEMLGTHMHWSCGVGGEINSELTSYIPMRLENDHGGFIDMKSFGISKAKFSFDKGFIDD